VTSNDYHSVLYKYQNARYAVFTDMIENSMLDLMVVSEPGKTSEFSEDNLGEGWTFKIPGI